MPGSIRAMLRDTVVPELRRFFAGPDHQVAVAYFDIVPHLLEYRRRVLERA